MRGIKKHIHPVPMASFNLPSRRPNFSALSNARLSSLLKISIPHWKEGVEEFLRNSF
jgi:dTDP-4-dehydrorhamnose reductase